MAPPVYAVDDPADLDVEKAAFEIYPLFVGTDNTVLRREYAAAMADMIGSPGEFHRYTLGNAGDLAVRRGRLLEAFRDNVRLLVDKTWVDGHDETSKAEALATLDALSDEMARGEFGKALGRFVGIADAVAVLLFGEGPSDDGFMDYVFRIDPRLGIFYWYVDRLRGQDRVEPDLAHLELLVGIYSLASF